MDENGVVPACMQRDCQRHNQAHRQYPKHHPSPAQPWHGGCSPCQNKSTPLSTSSYCAIAACRRVCGLGAQHRNCVPARVRGLHIFRAPVSRLWLWNGPFPVLQWSRLSRSGIVQNASAFQFSQVCARLVIVV